MVFDGYAPLVRRWNGYVPSSKSKHDTQLVPLHFVIVIVPISMKWRIPGPMGDTYIVEWVKETSPKEKVLIPNSGVSTRKEGDHKKSLN